MKKITVDQFTEALEAAVKERGKDYTYPTQEENPEYWELSSCRYEVEGEPACIIGAAIAHLGGDVTKIVHQGVAPVVAVMQAGLDLTRQGRIGAAMDVAQSKQDLGAPWGEALESYKEELEK